MDEPREFWESFYGDREQIWSGEPNETLVRHVSALPPGTALDLGCGEGADAIWLAEQGWRVVGVDISQTALDRASAHADAAGVADRIVWEHHDLSVSLPSGPFDLVSAQYLHSPKALGREDVLRRAAGTVAPTGRLLIVGHSRMPHADAQRHYPTAEGLVEALALSDEWTVEIIETLPRTVTAPNGNIVDIEDTVVMFRRSDHRL